MHYAQVTGFSQPLPFKASSTGKPKRGIEILKKIGADPENCLMVGNDLKEDAVAAELGIKTLIIEDKIIERKDSDYQVDWQGSLKEFKELIKKEV